MKTLRILVVDDEPPARAGLVQLLVRQPGVEVIGEAQDGRAALDAIRQLRPDAVFLDVQMPHLTGLEVAAALTPAERPAIVFVTAFDEFALPAFNLHAVDYLLKPFTQQRFLETFRRLETRLRRADHAELDQRLDALLQRLGTRAPAGASPRLVVKADGELHFVDPAGIRWIEGQKDYLRIHASPVTLFTRERMNDMEARLPAGFLRVHKSAIVNLDAVRRLCALPYGDRELELLDGARVRIGRSHWEKVEALMVRRPEVR